MDTKLKALKVADLKAILTKAEVQAPPKATKADLISRILESRAAQDAYSQLYEPEPEQDASDAPTLVEQQPEAENGDAEAEEPTAETSTKIENSVAATAPGVDPELEARRRRAERFGIPLVEPKAKPARKERPAKVGGGKAGVVKAEDADKLKARAERFGLKRAAPTEETVDPEEQERRRKRAERFGIPAKV